MTATTNYTPPPTYAEVILPGPKLPDGASSFVFNPLWLKWFLDLATIIGKSGITSSNFGAGIDHALLKNLQGGVGTTELYHTSLATTQVLAAGIDSGGTFPVAKLTPGGVNGYLQFNKGVISGFQVPT